jgi:hypothetical protein
MASTTNNDWADLIHMTNNNSSLGERPNEPARDSGSHLRPALGLSGPTNPVAVALQNDDLEALNTHGLNADDVTTLLGMRDAGVDVTSLCNQHLENYQAELASLSSAKPTDLVTKAHLPMDSWNADARTKTTAHAKQPLTGEGTGATSRAGARCRSASCSSCRPQPGPAAPRAGRGQARC